MRRTLATALPLCLLVLSCSHLAQAFGPDEGLDSAKAILDLGIQYYNEKRYSQAIAQYQKVLSDFPGTEYVAEAQFRIANVYHWGIKEPEEALVAYQTVVDNYPDSQFARTALVRMGSIYHWDLDKPDPHKAIEYYQRMLSQAPHSEYAPEALYWTGEAYMWAIEDVDKAFEAYQSVVDSYPESNYAADAMLRIAEIYRNEQWDDPRSIELYDRIVSGQYEGLSVGQARYSLGLHYLNIRHEPEIVCYKHITPSGVQDMDFCGFPLKLMRMGNPSGIPFLRENTKHHHPKPVGQQYQECPAYRVNYLFFGKSLKPFRKLT